MPRDTSAPTSTEASTTASATSTAEGSTSAPSSSSTTTAGTSDASSDPTPSSPTTEPAEETTPPDDDGEDNPSREAAKYRRRLRESEAETKRLTEENTELRERLERIHAEKLSEAVGGRVNLAALRGLDADLSGIVRDDGTVNTDRAKALLKEHELAPKVGAYIPASGTGQLGPTGAGPTWADAIRQRRQ